MKQDNRQTVETPTMQAMIAAQNRTADAIERLTVALKYLADVVGYGVDKKLTEAGITAREVDCHMTVQHQTKAAKEPDKTKAEPTVEEIRAAMNQFFKQQGKTAALDLIKKYAPSCRVEDVPPERYGELLMEVAA